MDVNEKLLQITAHPFGDAVTLQAIDLQGEDALSAPFCFRLTAVVDQVDFELGSAFNQPISFRVGRLSGEHRIFNGLIYQASKGYLNAAGEQTLQLLIRPWFYFLNDIIDSRVLAVAKPLTIPEIVAWVLKDQGYYDFKFELSNDYKPQTICVQYDESYFNFISRLLEQAGIYYYFSHNNDKHTMVLTDNPAPRLGGVAAAQYVSDTTTQAAITSWRHVAGAMPSMLSAQRYEFTTPSDVLAAGLASNDQAQGLPAQFLANMFHYDEHPLNTTADEMQQQLANKAAGLALAADYIVAQSSYPSWQAGTVFNLLHPDVVNESGEYYIYAMAYQVKDHSHLPAAKGAGDAEHYQNTFRAYQTTQNFVPQARYQHSKELGADNLSNTPVAQQPAIFQPTITGLHSATVVGPKDTPIYTDKYGRVKLQFNWDRYSANDENSFAWVRVKQAWASDQYGAHFTPRVGQEVMVSFEHGNPNKPLVVGIMPSGTSAPPFTPGATPTQTGFQSRSLSQNAEAQFSGGHRLMFDDDASNPSVNLHTYKDLDIKATNAHQVTVQGKTTTTLERGDFIQKIGGKYVINAEQAVHIINGNSQISITPGDIVIEADQILMG